MSTTAAIEPWEPLNIQIADRAELAMIVASAEDAADRAPWQALYIRATRIESLAGQARAAVTKMAQLVERASQPGWEGDRAVSIAAYQAQEIASLARQCRRQFTIYQRHRDRLEAGNSTVGRSGRS